MRNHAFYRPGFISCSMSWILWSYRVCMQQGLRTLSCLCGCTFGFRERTHECACMYCTWNLDSAPPEIWMKHSSWQHWEWCVRHSWTWPLCLFIPLYVRGHEKFSYSCEGTFVLNQQMGGKWIIMYVRMYLESKPPSPWEWVKIWLYGQYDRSLFCRKSADFFVILASRRRVRSAMSSWGNHLSQWLLWRVKKET